LEINSIIFIVILFVLLLVAMFFIPRWRLKRAIRQVVKIFREHSAIDRRSAKTIDELGLRPRGMVEGMFRGRDYKQYALNALMKSEIITQTEEGRFYLSEELLGASSLGKGISYYR